MIGSTQHQRPDRDHVRALSNDDLLDLFGYVGDEITSRLANYEAGATTPAALLDGIKFAKEADDCGTFYMYDLSVTGRICDAADRLTAALAALPEVA
jgi:hypothetical protein